MNRLLARQIFLIDVVVDVRKTSSIHATERKEENKFRVVCKSGWQNNNKRPDF
ncbi:unnamed protein product [Chironomus riparius]|uniref:Uncharacterized protein n=1 Tax=Chironomus riparius TaxID=315576 RepID=A0A9N9RK43_9DIPT|nr:unnamed protein product [Chironomus riparius]